MKNAFDENSREFLLQGAIETDALSHNSDPLPTRNPLSSGLPSQSYYSEAEQRNKPVRNTTGIMGNFKYKSGDKVYPSTCPGIIMTLIMIGTPSILILIYT